MNEQESPVQTNNRRLSILLGVLLAISLSANIFQWLRTERIIEIREITELRLDTLALQKHELDLNFNLAVEELNAYKGRSEQLDSLLAEANLKLEEQRRQISRLIDEKQDAEVLKQRYEEMRRIKDEYLQRIIELEEENRRLKFEVTELSVALDQKTSEAQNLKGKVDVASRLTVSSLNVEPLSVRGDNRTRATDKARRTDRLSISFTVEENQIAAKGERTAFLRIFNPQGFVMADVGQVKKFVNARGEEIPYSRSLRFDFDGDRTTRNVTWEQEVFSAGDYKVEVFIDGELVASQIIRLN